MGSERGSDKTLGVSGQEDPEGQTSDPLSLYLWMGGAVEESEDRREKGVYLSFRYLRGVGSRTPVNTKVRGCSGPLYEMVWYLHRTHTHAPYALNHLQIAFNTQNSVNAM